MSYDDSWDNSPSASTLPYGDDSDLPSNNTDEEWTDSWDKPSKPAPMNNVPAPQKSKKWILVSAIAAGVVGLGGISVPIIMHAKSNSDATVTLPTPTPKGMEDTVEPVGVVDEVTTEGTTLVNESEGNGLDGGIIEAPPIADTRTLTPNWAAVTASVKDSVVSIYADEWSGSGFILDKAGYIVTNAHVVDDVRDFAVTFADGRVFEARGIYADYTTDTGIIRLLFPPDDLSPVTLGDSSILQVGDPVLAIGNNFGMSNTSTYGAVSALNRPFQTIGDSYINAIQIDASINHGNSGGPLFNAAGEVIGINYAGLGDYGAQGLNFTIPINLVQRVATQIIEKGKPQHAYLGVDTETTLVAIVRQDRFGAEITSVASGSPAASAGLRVGDVIIRIDDIEINTIDAYAQLVSWLHNYQANDRITVTVVRDGDVIPITVTLATAPATPPRTGGNSDSGSTTASDSEFVGTWFFVDVYIHDFDAFLEVAPSWQGSTKAEVEDELYERWASESGDYFTVNPNGTITNWTGEPGWDGTTFTTWKADDGGFEISDSRGNTDWVFVQDDGYLYWIDEDFIVALMYMNVDN